MHQACGILPVCNTVLNSTVTKISNSEEIFRNSLSIPSYSQDLLFLMRLHPTRGQVFSFFSPFACQITVRVSVCHLKKESTPNVCTVDPTYLSASRCIYQTSRTRRSSSELLKIPKHNLKSFWRVLVQFHRSACQFAKSLSARPAHCFLFCNMICAL